LEGKGEEGRGSRRQSASSPRSCERFRQERKGGEKYVICWITPEPGGGGGGLLSYNLLIILLERREEEVKIYDRGEKSLIFKQGGVLKGEGGVFQFFILFSYQGGKRKGTENNSISILKKGRGGEEGGKERGRRFSRFLPGGEGLYLRGRKKTIFLLFPGEPKVVSLFQRRREEERTVFSTKLGERSLHSQLGKRKKGESYLGDENFTRSLFRSDQFRGRGDGFMTLPQSFQFLRGRGNGERPPFHTLVKRVIGGGGEGEGV